MYGAGHISFSFHSIHGSKDRMKPASTKLALSAGQTVVYPAHGVGTISGIETQEIAGMSLELLVIDFPQSKMTLRLPKAKAISSGLRGVSSRADVEKALDVLKGKSRSRKGIWSRRASEFEAKIKSGELVQIAEVIRDLARADDGSSYSERQIFEAAHGRLVAEVSEAMSITETEAAQLIESRMARTLQKAAGNDEDEVEDAAA